MAHRKGEGRPRKGAGEGGESGPERTCCGSREAWPADDLERFVLIGDELVFDARRRAPGRGAWVRAEPKYIERAARGGFKRAFKAPIEAPPPAELIAAMRAGIEVRLCETLQVGVRARHVQMGASAVSEGLKSAPQGALVVFAADAGQATRRKYARSAEGRGMRAVRAPLEGERLGRWLGRGFLAVLLVSEPTRASRVERDLRHLASLGRSALESAGKPR